MEWCKMENNLMLATCSWFSVRLFKLCALASRLWINQMLLIWTMPALHDYSIQCHRCWSRNSAKCGTSPEVLSTSLVHITAK